MTRGVDGVVRLRDVAALAGVSVGTASKALNGTGQLSAATRERVRSAAVELDFRVNSVARGLVSGRTFTVGVITTDSFGRFSIPVMLGAEDELGAGQVAVVLCDTRDDPERERHYTRSLLARQVDGIIVTGRRTEGRDPLQHRTPVPVVYAFTPSRHAEDLSVVVDEEAGARLAVDHLVGLGRHRVAVVTGPQRHWSARRRARAAVSALAAAGVEPVVPPLFGEWSEEWGRAAVDTLPLRDLDAVVGGSDQVARGVVDGLRERGARVPEDVAVTGFDDWDVIALASRPPLTSVDMRLEELGRQAARQLLAAIDGRETATRTVVAPRLVVRGSTVGP